MTRKDFELIARAIKETHMRQWNNVPYAFADALEKHAGNANFDRAKFLKACGVQEG